MEGSEEQARSYRRLMTRERSRQRIHLDGQSRQLVFAAPQEDAPETLQFPELLLWAKINAVVIDKTLSHTKKTSTVGYVGACCTY